MRTPASQTPTSHGRRGLRRAATRFKTGGGGAGASDDLMSSVTSGGAFGASMGVASGATTSGPSNVGSDGTVSIGDSDTSMTPKVSTGSPAITARPAQPTA